MNCFFLKLLSSLPCITILDYVCGRNRSSMMFYERYVTNPKFSLCPSSRQLELIDLHSYLGTIFFTDLVIAYELICHESSKVNIRFVSARVVKGFRIPAEYSVHWRIIPWTGTCPDKNIGRYIFFYQIFVEIKKIIYFLPALDRHSSKLS